jgi:hypothetical protein
MHLRHIVDTKMIRLVHDNYRELGSGLGESKNARPLQVPVINEMTSGNA